MTNTSTPIIPNGLATIPGTVPGGAPGVVPGTTGLAVLDTFTKADLVAVLRVEEEERLNVEQNEAHARLSALSSKIATLTAKLDESAKKAVDGIDTSDLTTAAAALKSAFGMKTEITTTLASRDDEHKKFKVTLTLNDKGKSYSNTIGSNEVSVPFSRADIDTLGQIKTLQKEVVSAQSQLISLKREVANLPALERKAAASLAMHVLNQSEQGQQILANLRRVKPITSVVAA